MNLLWPSTKCRILHGSAHKPSSNNRSGMTSLLAMLFLCLMSTLAIGFYASTTTSTQIAGNDRRANDAQTAMESGLGFIKYELVALNLPYGTTPANLMANVVNKLGFHLNGSTNMGANVVANTAGTIYLPNSTGWIDVDPAVKTRFRIAINQVGASNVLNVVVRGGSANSTITRAVQLQFKPATGFAALMGLNSVSLSGGAFTDSYNSSIGVYGVAPTNKKGNIASNGNITLDTGAIVNGDARYGPGKAITLLGGSSVTGRKAPLPDAVTFPSVTLPASGVTDIGDVTMNAGTVTYPGGVYRIGALTLSGTAHIVWTGPVTLYIATSYSCTGGAAIDTFGNLPANRTLNFLPTCATAVWSGSNVCIGELYAPDTAFTISGTVQLMGRVTAKSIVNTSTGGMHSDEALPLPGGAGGYAPDLGSYLEVP
jgi:hypothetical protein